MWGRKRTGSYSSGDCLLNRGCEPHHKGDPALLSGSLHLSPLGKGLWQETSGRGHPRLPNRGEPSCGCLWTGVGRRLQAGEPRDSVRQTGSRRPCLSPAGATALACRPPSPRGRSPSCGKCHRKQMSPWWLGCVGRAGAQQWAPGQEMEGGTSLRRALLSG